MRAAVPTFVRRLWPLALALVLSLAAAMATVVHDRRALLAELAAEGAALHRLASQRADQHDAHLTALSAVATAGDSPRPDLFLEVATTVVRFYSRIDAIDLVALDGGPTATTRPRADAGVEAAVRAAARASTGALVFLPAPGAAGHYLLVKRSPNSDAARYGLSLQIDGAALIGSDQPFWQRPGVARWLSLPDGTILAGQAAPAPDFEKVLGSASQPFLLRAALPGGPLGGGSAMRAAVAALAVGAVCAVALAVLRQARGRRRAERQAALSAQEARLAHAARVNALGEMASGMAHELTQPLTAILSLAQAGRRLLRAGDAARLLPVLDDTVMQARRASDILDRLRRWTQPAPPVARATPLADAVRNVEALLALEAARAGISLRSDLPAEALPVRADPVELEQVIFNLVRNALDALGGAGAGERRVTVTARPAGTHAIMTVADTGPGIPPDIRDRIFAPFVTGRPGGTGLGLALCQRLVERMGGEIAPLPSDAGAVFEVRLPLAGEVGAAA